MKIFLLNFCFFDFKLKFNITIVISENNKEKNDKEYIEEKIFKKKEGPIKTSIPLNNCRIKFLIKLITERESSILLSLDSFIIDNNFDN